MRTKKEAASLNNKIKTVNIFPIFFFVIIGILCVEFITTFNPLFGSSL